MTPHDQPDDSNTSPEKPDSYLYRSAGITERLGHVPVWLIFVIIGLFAWGGYYLLEFWSPP